MLNSPLVSGREIWVVVATMLKARNKEILIRPQRWVSHCILTEALNAGLLVDVNGDLVPFASTSPGLMSTSRPVNEQWVEP